MKIVHFTNDLASIGGAQRLILEMARVNAPPPLSVITWHSADIELKKLDLEGVMDILPLRPLSWAKVRKAHMLLTKASVVHVHSFPSLYLAAFFSWGPKIYTEHSTWNRRRSHSVLRTLEKIIYSRYDRICAISQDVAQALEQWVGAIQTPITVVPNGIPLDRFKGRKRTLKLNEEVAIGMVASFSKSKDQDCIVRALRHLPMRFKAYFAGEGSRIEIVRQLSRSLGVENRVGFLGAIDWVPRFLDTIDVYVQSSHWEGFGLAAVESMASGLPTIGSDVPGLSSIIGDSKMLFPEGSDLMLAQCLHNLAACKSTYQDASQFSLARASHYSILTTVQGYHETYQAVENCTSSTKKNLY